MSKNYSPLLLIDGYGFIFRAFHVLPPLSSPDGQPVGAVYGFTSMLLKLLSDFKPQKVIVVFDSGGKNFRHQLYSEYKAHRPEVPEELILQFTPVRTAAFNLNFMTIEKDGYEADDIIATIATKALSAGEEVVIISSDKDLMQLINGDGIKMYDPLKNKYITTEGVFTKFGVEPIKVAEVLALIGDKSDNIPGVKSIGPKTAAELINKFGTVENIFENIEEVTNKRQRDILLAEKENALLSRKLVALDTNVPFNEEFKIVLKKSVWQPPETEKINGFLSQYGFQSLFKRVEHLFNIKMEHSATLIEKAASSPIIPLTTITTKDELSEIIQNFDKNGYLSIYLHNYNPQETTLFLASQNHVYQIIINQPTKNTLEPDLFSYNTSTQATDHLYFLEDLLKIFADSSITKITYDLKKLLRYFEYFKQFTTKPIQFKAFEDLHLMFYLLSAGNHKSDSFAKVIDPANIKAKQNSEIIKEITELLPHFTEQFTRLKQKLYDKQLLWLYREVDLPLCQVIHTIEQNGIKVDVAYLHSLSSHFYQVIEQLTQKIYALVGLEFNIASPKQLGEILFEKMQMPFAKLSSKAKTYSTGVDVLEKLSESGYEIADLILEWRHLTKLKNTYTEALPKQINLMDGRIHTTFLQTSTTTGRLSSHDPNLQNIPIRTEEGNKIRKAFVAIPGHKLISADYSQIELRILSHIADITALKNAFLHKEDIHTQTACQIFKITKEQITSDHRRKAKAINFGIIYGISGFGLAKQLNISVSEASKYIEQYFAEYPGIKEYMEKTKNYAREHGYVKDLFNRLCFVPTINDRNQALRQLAERAAINAPIQGTNADIIRIAMLNLSKILPQKNFKTKILLQIHDELLFEAPNSEVGQVKEIIRNVMQDSSPLSVPTIVDIKIGDNWLEMA